MTKQNMIDSMEKVLDSIVKDYKYYQKEMMMDEIEESKNEFKNTVQSYNLLLNTMYTKNNYSFPRNIQTYINVLDCKAV